MLDQLFYFVMVPMVYVSIAWCIFWIVVKIAKTLRAPNTPPTLRIFPDDKDPEDWNTGGLPGAIWDAFTMPSVLKYNPLLWFYLAVFHICLAILFLAHLDLLPQVNIMSEESANMIGSGAVGFLLTLSVLYFLFRRFLSPLRELSVPADYLLLFLIFCLFLTGDVISWGNSWSESGFGLTKQDFGLYLQNLFTFNFSDPREVLDHPHYSIVVSHVLLANLFLLILPFSKIMHVFFAVPMNALRRG
jgi:nitrate reductase gamma subunit